MLWHTSKMLYDCNLTKKDKTFCLSRGLKPENYLEFVVFALTPGIPAEYVNYLLYIPHLERPKYRQIVEDLRHEAEPLAFENAGTISIDDGWKMLTAVRKRRNYNGIIPHWSALALQELCREKPIKELAAELRVSRFTIMRWRRSQFHPLTLRRMVGPRFPWLHHYQPFEG